MSGGPVAGRRRGLASTTITTDVPSFASAPTQIEVPAWLSETDTNAAPSTAALTPAMAPTVHVTQHVADPTDVTHDDPLAFLDEATSEGATSLSGMAASHSPLHVSTNVPTQGLPAIVTTGRAGLEQEWRRLQAELAAIEVDTHTSNTAIAALQNESDPLCREVTAITQTLLTRQSEYAAQHQQREAQRTTRTSPTADSRDKTGKDDDDDDDTATAAALARLESTYQQRVDELTAALSAQCAAVAAAQDELTAAQTQQRERVTVQALTTAAVGQMQERLESIIRDMRAKVTLQVQPMLARHIRAAMTAAAEQRRDIAAQDEQRRQRALRQFIADSTRDWAAFRTTQQSHCQRRSDRLVGEVAELLRQQQARRTSFLQQCTARDTSAIAQATQQSAQAAQEALQRVARITEDVAVQCAQQDAEEERRLGERCRGELQAYMVRAAEAKRALCTRHRITLSNRAAEAPVTQHCDSTSPTAPSTCNSQERLRVSLLRLSQTVLMHTRQAKEAVDRHGEQTAMLGCGGATLASCCEPSTSTETTVGSQIAELGTLRLRLSTLCGNTIGQLDMARTALRERRAKLLGLRAHIALTQKSWNAEVRAALSAVLVSRTARHGVVSDDDDNDDSGPEAAVRMPQCHTTHLVSELTRRVAAVCGGSARGRQARRVFLNTVRAQKEALDVALQRTAVASQALVALQERVSNAVVLVETRRAVLSTRSAQVSQLRDRVHRERRQLTYRRHELERAAERLHRSSNFFFDAAKMGESDENDEPTPSLPQVRHEIFHVTRGRALPRTRSSSSSSGGAASSQSFASAREYHGMATALQASAMRSGVRPELVCPTTA